MQKLRASPEDDERVECRVRLWFGSHALHTYRADQDVAQRYAHAIGKRFKGLRVTVDNEDTDGLRQLPCMRLWMPTP